MDWDSLDCPPLSSARLIQSTDFEVIAGDVEYRNGIYYLHEDEVMSLQLQDSNLFVRSIYPESDISYDIDADNNVELNGSVLSGDNKGRLSIGVYNKTLEYPLQVIEFQLSAPFHIRGRVSVSEDGVSLKRLDISNMPETASNSYPYSFQYNLSNSINEDDWKDFPDSSIKYSIEGYGSYDIQQGPSNIWDKFCQGFPVRIRLCSAVGKQYYFEAICKRSEIIRFSDNEPIVELKEWIGLPKSLSITHQKYRFNEDEMIEEWVEFPKLFFSSAKQWLDFEPFGFELKSSSATMLKSGTDILVEMSINLSQSSELIEFIDRFFETISIEVNGSALRLPSVEKMDINNGGSEVTFSVIVPVPKSDIIFKTKRVGLNQTGGKIYVKKPFNKKNWNLKLELTFPSKPKANPTRLMLSEWTESFITTDKAFLASRVHPENMILRKCIFEKVGLNGGMFCPECHSLWGGLPTCTNYNCNWSIDSKNLVALERISDDWFTYSGGSSSGNHFFSVDESKLSKGEYVISWNDLSYEFKILNDGSFGHSR